MGFQTGTTIRPELGNADYSGFSNAAAITADAYAKLGDQIGSGIEQYKKNKKDEKGFAQQVKSSLAMTDAMMENLSPEGADQLARFATEQGVNDPRLSMEERAMAAQQFSAGLDAILESIRGDEITFQLSPDKSVVATSVGGKVKDVTRTGRDQLFDFGGTPTQKVDNQPLTPEEQKYLAELRARQ